MGLNYRLLSRIVDNEKELFKNKKIISLGVLYPFLSRKEIDRLFVLGLDKNFTKENFASHFFKDILKAKEFHTLDISDYQGAELIANLNIVLEDKFKNSYDVVLDAGTVEHLSNTPVAIQNIFDLLKDDGIFYFGSPCNNWVNHGFFQFSPTFFKDLDRYNSSIKLQKLSLEIPAISKSFDLVNISDLYSLAIFNTFYKTGLQGTFRKINSQRINFNFIQEKYDLLFENKLKVHNSLLKKTNFDRNKLKIKSFASSLILTLIRNPLIPLQIRFIIVKLVNLVNYFLKNIS